MDKRKIETNECSKARSVFEEKNDDQDEEIELSLGLSLNGKFGVDPKAKKIKRSSSIPEFIDPSRLEEKALGGGALVRACSLPAEGEDEMRKRKEVQMLRRKEAKRKRSEKQRNLKLSRQRSCEVAINKVDSNIRCGKPPLAPSPLSQGSVGSHGTGSSGITESENQSTPGVNKHAEGRSRGSISIQSLKVNEQKREAAFANLVDNMCKFVELARYKTSSTGKANNSDKELIKNFFRAMPFVSTKGDGSNGKNFDGFLYRYKKGEDVMIMCLCHGSLLTPAKFVNHAGGADVINPLRHIVVNPSPFL